MFQGRWGIFPAAETFPTLGGCSRVSADCSIPRARPGPWRSGAGGRLPRARAGTGGPSPPVERRAHRTVLSRLPPVSPSP